MTPQDLQDALIAEWRTLFRDYLAPAPDKTRKPLHFFPQELPLQQSTEDAAASRCPYLLTIVQNGAEDDGGGTVSVAIVACVCDYGEDKQGHREILHIIHAIRQRFRATPDLASQFVCRPKVEWTLEEEQPWPFYFGGVKLTFEVPAIQKEDSLA